MIFVIHRENVSKDFEKLFKFSEEAIKQEQQVILVTRDNVGLDKKISRRARAIGIQIKTESGIAKSINPNEDEHYVLFTPQRIADQFSYCSHQILNSLPDSFNAESYDSSEKGGLLASKLEDHSFFEKANSFANSKLEKSNSEKSSKTDYIDLEDSEEESHTRYSDFFDLPSSEKKSKTDEAIAFETISLDLDEIGQKIKSKTFYREDKIPQNPEVRVSFYDTETPSTETTPLLNATHQANTKQFTETDFIKAFRDCAKFFPTDATPRDIALTTFAIILAAISVMQIAFYGGSFTVNFAKKIAEELGIDLSEGELESIRLVFALAFAVLDNLAINTLSAKDAAALIINKVQEIIAHEQVYDYETILKKFKLVLSLIGEMAAAGVSAVPTYFTAYAASQAEKMGIKLSAFLSLLQALVQATISLLGWKTLTQNIRGIINPEMGLTAQQIKIKILKMLNKILPVEQQISDADIEDYVSKGQLYRDKHPSVRKGMTKSVFILTLIYLYYTTVLPSQEGLAADTPTTKTVGAVFWMIFLYLIVAATTATKYGFLSGNSNKAFHAVNDAFGEPIFKDSQDTKMRRLQIAGVLAVAIFAFLSLPGGEGVFHKYSGPDKEKWLNMDSSSIGSFVLTIFFTLLGAWGTNHNSFFNFLKKGVATAKRTLFRMNNTDENCSRNLYCETRVGFIKQLMKAIGTLPEEAVFNNYCQNVKDEQNYRPEDVFRMRKDGTIDICNRNFINLLSAVTTLQYTDEENFDAFLLDQINFLGKLSLASKKVLEENFGQDGQKKFDVTQIRQQDDLPRPAVTALKEEEIEKILEEELNVFERIENQRL